LRGRAQDLVVRYRRTLLPVFTHQTAAHPALRGGPHERSEHRGILMLNSGIASTQVRHAQQFGKPLARRYVRCDRRDARSAGVRPGERRKASTRLIAAHRIDGYLFIALFCVMGYFMVSRLGDVAGGAPPSTMIHLTLAMVLRPLLFRKVLVARYYKTYYSFLMPIGLVIFVLSFVLIGITAGPSLAHHARMQTVSLETIDLPPAAKWYDSNGCRVTGD